MKKLIMMTCFLFATHTTLANHVRSYVRIKNTTPANSSMMITDRFDNHLTSESGDMVTATTPTMGETTQTTKTQSVTPAKTTMTATPATALMPKNMEISFDTNSTTIDRATTRELETFVKGLKKSGVQAIKITGFADTRGSRAYNTTLSQKRARAVEKMLQQNGIATNKMTTIGAGSKETTDLSTARVVEIKVIK